MPGVCRECEVGIDSATPSTEAYDRSTKLDYYPKIPSLRAYVLVSERTYRVQVYERNGEEWTCSVAEGLDQTVHVKEPDVQLRLANLYEGVGLEPGGMAL